MSTSKRWYESKTMWFGLLWILIGVAGLFGFADFVPSTELEQVAEIVNGIFIVVLRYVTDTSIQ